MTSHEDAARLRRDRQLVTLEGLLAIEVIELRPTLDRAALLLANVMGCEKIDIFLYQAATQTLVAQGISPTPMGQRQTQIGLDRQPVANGGRSVEVYQTGQPYLSGHVDQDEGELLGIRQGLRVRSEIIVPLAVAGQRRGILVANSTESERFPKADLDFLSAVARWVGMVTRRAELSEQVTRQAEERGRRAALEEAIGRLSPRELAVAALLVEGLTNAQIARRLVITEGTVANYIRSILAKLGVPSRARIAAIMAQLGIEPPSEAGTGGS